MPNGLITLMEGIVSHMDKDGFAFPSIERLSMITGLSRSTVLSYIKAIANNSIRGKVLLYKQTIKRGKNQHDINMYYIPESIVAFTDIDDLQLEEEKVQNLQIQTSSISLPDIYEMEEEFVEGEKQLDNLLL